jgi:signal transduction histidine kinase
MYTVLLYFFAAAAAIVAYQAFSFLIRCLKTRSNEALWCLGFAVFSALDTLLYIPMYMPWEHSATVVKWGMFIGYLSYGAYIKCMTIYFGSGSRLLHYASNVILAIAGVYLCAFVFGELTGQSIVLYERSTPLDLQGQMIPAYLMNHFEFTSITSCSHAAIRVIMLVSLIFLLITGDVKRDRVIQIGILITVFALLHNVVTVLWARQYFIPLIPFMNLIEIARLEWLARRGEALHLEQYEERVDSFQNAMKEHLKLKKIGEGAASFIHDAINIAFLTESKLSLAELKANALDDQGLKDDIVASRNANNRLMKLLSDSREAYLIPQTHEPLDISALIDEAIDMARHRVRANEVTIQCTGRTDRTLQGDPIKFSLVIFNLINNACDAIADQPERWIKIHSEDQDQQTLITVGNSGSRIPADMNEKIFNPFFTTKSAGGSGLGLKICRDTVTAMDGELTLNTDSEHTQFDIVLP